MPDFDLIHASGKWDLVAANLGADMAGWLSAGNVVVTTETSGLSTAAVTKIVGSDRFFRGPNLPGQDECFLAWPETFESAGEGRVAKLSDKQYRQPTGHLRPKFYATVKPLRHIASGEVVTFIAAHMPLRNTPLRVEVSNDALEGMAALVNSIEGHRVVSCDWNIPYRTAAGRALLARVSGPTGLHLAWDDEVDTFDTKRSLIDGVLTDLPVRYSDLLPAVASSDHWPVRVGLTIPATVTPRPVPIPEVPVTHLPANLPEILRAAGLKVVEHDGWQTRGRPASTGGFAPVGVLCHHTATSKATSDANVVKLLIGGRSDLPGPLCHMGLARDGTVHLIAAGRANHAGKAKASGSVAAGDGNVLYIGIEAFNDGVGEKWPDVQYDAYALLAAVLSRWVTRNSVESVRGHKETSVTGKIDPTFSMPAFRVHVAGAETRATTAKPAPPPKLEPTVNRMAQVVALLKEIAADPKNTTARRARARAALALLPPK